jgi:hypothetical protein
MPASEGMAENSGDRITTLSEPDKGVDWLHGPGPSYGNDGCIGRAGLVSESCPFGVVLHDEGSKARNEPEAKVVSIVVIKWDKRAYNSCSEMEGIVLAGKTYREWQDFDALGENMGQELRSKQRSERESVH